MELHPLARHFASVAEAYERGRPEYAPAVIGATAAELGIRAPDPVLDLAAGTGKLTRALVTYGFAVVAVEPQEPLRTVLTDKVDARRMALISWIAGLPEPERVRGYPVVAAALSISAVSETSRRSREWRPGPHSGEATKRPASAFRTVVIPLQAALMNVLSIGAAYGVLTAIFQFGWLHSLIGPDSAVEILSYVPLFMFAVLFGLSMEYEVFLVSQIEEHVHAGEDNQQSVVSGLVTSARVITAAATIMVFVLGSFVVNGDPTVKQQFGIGLAVAVILDPPSCAACSCRHGWS